MLQKVRRQISQLAASADAFKLLINLYPPYLGAGVKTRYVASDFSAIDIEMPLRWYNRNYFGTQFGGSLYSMVDPFYCLMLVKQLGSNYIVWDKGAEINFVTPGQGPVIARFRLERDAVEDIRQQASPGKPVLPEFDVIIEDMSGKTVARIRKRLYVRQKS